MAVVAGFVAAGTAPAATYPTATFGDAGGDSATGPDISGVTVSADAIGNLTFRVAIANRPTLTRPLDVYVRLDTDRNSTTGRFGGELNLFGSFGGSSDGIWLDRWDGAAWVDAGGAPAAGGYANGVATFTVRAADLGATALGFWVGATDDWDDDTNFDAAPDSGEWSYALVAETPAVPLQLRLDRWSTIATRGPATSFRQFVTAMGVVRTDTGAVVRGTITCRATLAGKILVGRFYTRGGTANCSWLVPKTARGKALRGTMTVAWQGRRVARAFSYRVA
jgi:hypothetical protein